jgi:SOS-response transcriptional repressor LexA
MNKKQYQTAEIQHFGDVGCGRVVEFRPRREKLFTVLPVNVKADQVGAFEACGMSLSERGIFDGDILIAKKVFKRSEVTANSILIVRVVSTNEILAKTAMYQNQEVRLMASGGGARDTYHEPDDVEVQGLVFQVIKDVGPDGRVKLGEQEEIPY